MLDSPSTETELNKDQFIFEPHCRMDVKEENEFISCLFGGIGYEFAATRKSTLIYSTEVLYGTRFIYLFYHHRLWDSKLPFCLELKLASGKQKTRGYHIAPVLLRPPMVQ